MYNTDLPTRAELPSSKQLVRSSVIAAVVAAVLLVTVVMPADYGVDPTRIGRLLGLTDMGEIKAALAAEAMADAQAAAIPAATSAPAPAPAPIATTDTAQQAAAQAAAPAAAMVEWKDTTPFTLKPSEGIEIKLVMKEGAKAQFAWAVEGGVVNFETHGDGSGNSISYEKGRGAASDDGELVAAFTGNHGWFWRNRGAAAVKVVLHTAGDYSALKK